MKTLTLLLLAPVLALAQKPAQPTDVKTPVPQKTAVASVPPVEVKIPAADEETLNSAWKDVEIAQLKLQIRIQSILARDPKMSYDLQSHKFYKPAEPVAKPEEPVKKP